MRSLIRRTSFICDVLSEDSKYIPFPIFAIGFEVMVLNLRNSASLLYFLGRICVLPVCHFFGFLILPADVLFMEPKYVAFGYKNICLTFVIIGF